MAIWPTAAPLVSSSSWPARSTCSMMPSAWAMAWEVDGIPSILDMVRQNFGYAVLPLLALRADASHETLSANPIVAPTWRPS